MRINRLWIEDFRNLKDFTLDFGEEKEKSGQSLNTTVIIGQNGTGKSNLFEAIVLIFRNLDIGIVPCFSYKIHYTRKDLIEDSELKIYIEANVKAVDKHRAYRIEVNGKRIEFSKFFMYRRKKFLPKTVFTYYSGRNDRLESCFDIHEKKYIKNVSKDIATAQRPFFYVKDGHSQFVLLSYFSISEEDIKNTKAKQFLKDFIDINELDSILFTFKTPDNKHLIDDVDSFFGFYGNVAQYIKSIYDKSLAPIFDSGTNRLYIFLKDLKQYNEMVVELGDGRSIFQKLESLQIANCIEKIDIIVKKKYEKDEVQISFYDLSEGEQQLLTVMGMLRYYEDKESLFLLDEPDTHLNPKWKLEYLKMLEDAVGENAASHILISTHDPIMVGGLIKEQIRILRKEGSNGYIVSYQPQIDPRGMGVAGLLTSELFGFRSILDLHTLELLDEKRRIALKKELSREDRERLTMLNEKLNDLDFSIFRDSTYNMFVYAYSQLEKKNELNKSILSPEDVERRKKLAEDVLEIIMSIGGKES